MQTTWEVYAITSVFLIPALLIFFKAFREFKNDNDSSKTEKERTLSQEKMEQINKLVRDHLTDKKPFLQKRYSITQLAGDIQIPQHHLSAFINSYYQMNFNDLINKYRVAYSKIMLINGDWKHKTLQGISAECGFGNRTTFHTAFKKATGQNPSDFIQALKNGQGQDKMILDEIEQIFNRHMGGNKLTVVRRA